MPSSPFYTFNGVIMRYFKPDGRVINFALLKTSPITQICLPGIKPVTQGLTDRYSNHCTVAVNSAPTHHKTHYLQQQYMWSTKEIVIKQNL